MPNDDDPLFKDLVRYIKVAVLIENVPRAQKSKTDCAVTEYLNELMMTDVGRCCNCGSRGSDDKPLKACAACGKTKYFSKICQKEKWSFHKSACNKENTKEYTKDKADRVAWHDNQFANHGLWFEDVGLHSS